MLHVYYSNRTETLVEALVQNMGAERARRGVLAPIELVVPNRNIETYLKLRLAEATGIATNLKVGLLRRRLGELAEHAVPGARAVGLPQIEGHLLALLHEDAVLAPAAMEPVRDYLSGAGAKPDALDRRRCQLAFELAKLFDEYAVSRPEMLDAWATGRAVLAGRPAYAATEAWEAGLWRAVFARGGRMRRPWAPLMSLIAEAGAGLACPPLHVFGISYVARGYQRMLAAVAAHTEVHVYTLNPCREFWEDVETAGEIKKRVRQSKRTRLFPSQQQARQAAQQQRLALDDDPMGLTSEGEALALRLWGRPGRENIRLLNQLNEGDFEGRFVTDDAAARNLLSRVQGDVLERATPTAPDPEARADGSIQVIRCRGLRRELEVVAAEIWRFVRADSTLRFNDIAVVVPDARKDAYLSHVGAVFGEANDLPHNVADLAIGGGHRLGEAIERLLALPLGGFTRRELLPLCTHPAVMARFPEARTGHWLRLVDDLGIVHGADHADHAGTYITRDVLNWDQGLRRLALGVLMTGPRSGDDTPVAFGGDLYLPEECTPDEESGALGFALLVRSLIEDARFANGTGGAPRVRPLSEWLELMRGLLSTYLLPADEEEAGLLGRCLVELQKVEEAELGGLPVSYRVAYELCSRALGDLGAARGAYLARGVTVSSFLPMRAIPFRVVFVVGLGHGIFPRAFRRSALDLREAERLPGDVSPREQDLYMFLETLLCARERLTLTYVCRDELTGESLPPSSVLLELREVLAQVLPPEELDRVFNKESPLRRYDDADRLAAAPIAQREEIARRLGQSLRETLPAGTAVPDIAGLRRGLPATTMAALATRLDLTAPPETAGASAARLVVPLSALRQFLVDPLQGSARFRLRLREVEGDEAVLEHDEEAFGLGALSQVMLLREVMTRGLLESDGGDDVGAVMRAYERALLREELSGRAPTGLFGTAERITHCAVLRNWLDDLAAFGGGGRFARRVVHFGRASEYEPAGDLRPALVLDVEEPVAAGAEPRRLRVELYGRTELLVAPSNAAEGSVVLTCRKHDDSIKRGKDFLRAFIDHLMLAATGTSETAHQALVARSTGDEHEIEAIRFRAITVVQARFYLGELVRDMLTGALDAGGRPTGVHDYLLPCEAILKTGANAAGQAIVEEIERLRDNYFEQSFLTFSSVQGPVPEAIERHDPPPAALALLMATRRFGLYFDLIEAKEKR